MQHRRITSLAVPSWQARAGLAGSDQVQGNCVQFLCKWQWILGLRYIPSTLPWSRYLRLSSQRAPLDNKKSKTCYQKKTLYALTRRLLSAQLLDPKDPSLGSENAHASVCYRFSTRTATRFFPQEVKILITCLLPALGATCSFHSDGTPSRWSPLQIKY